MGVAQLAEPRTPNPVDVGSTPTTHAIDRIDPAAVKVLSVHFPDAESLGDMTLVDSLDPWRPDVLVAGLPCQPVSQLNLGASGDEDERWLFDDLAALLGRSEIRPALVLENVEGVLRKGAAPLGRFISAIEGLGYSVRTRLFDASTVGAPHRRRRWWAVGLHPEGSTPQPAFAAPGSDEVMTLPTPTGRASRHQTGEFRVLSQPGLLLPTVDGKSPYASNLGEGTYGMRLPAPLLPTPVTNSGRPNPSGLDGGTQLSAPGLLLPTPTGNSYILQPASDKYTFLSRSAFLVDGGLADQHGNIDPSTGWGPFQPAIDQWGGIIGRSPPRRVASQHCEYMLSARLIEWMMGYPDGWVRDHVSRTAAFRLLGNAVVSRQASGAVEALLSTGTLF